MSAQYEVLEDCYVPVAHGVKFKRAGQIVTLDDADAADVAGLVDRLNGAPKPKSAPEPEPELEPELEPEPVTVPTKRRKASDGA